MNVHICIRASVYIYIFEKPTVLTVNGSGNLTYSLKTKTSFGWKALSFPSEMTHWDFVSWG